MQANTQSKVKTIDSSNGRLQRDIWRLCCSPPDEKTTTRYTQRVNAIASLRTPWNVPEEVIGLGWNLNAQSSSSL